MSNTKTENRTCANCRFYDARKCRRYAPRPHRKGEGLEAPTVWPIVAPDDWCGEWETNNENLRGLMEAAKVLGPALLP